MLQGAGVPLQRARVAIFGYGDVARRAAGLLAEQGALVVADGLVKVVVGARMGLPIAGPRAR